MRVYVGTCHSNLGQNEMPRNAKNWNRICDFWSPCAQKRPAYQACMDYQQQSMFCYSSLWILLDGLLYLDLLNLRTHNLNQTWWGKVKILSIIRYNLRHFIFGLERLFISRVHFLGQNYEQVLTRFDAKGTQATYNLFPVPYNYL